MQTGETMMKKTLFIITLILISTTLFSCQFQSKNQEKVLTIYTERHYDTDQLLYDRFTELTGIKVNLIKDDADKLITRIQNEGKDTEADALIIADAGRLGRAKALELFKPFESSILDEQVPT